MHLHIYIRVCLKYPIARALGFRPPNVLLTMDDLALQVRLINHIELNDAKGADPGGCQVKQSWAAQATGANAKHLGVLQALLASHAHIGND
ncbi:unannotated protein [freshwater metagenome]|uniref:Unannotated protein n=1 Tax=freshwater metagenome TaxID=449393 RepID=A0A6J6N233_9ZZZZ